MITLVSGFQRCGTSLMLQMLNAGGMTVYHSAEMGYPAFEAEERYLRMEESAG